MALEQFKTQVLLLHSEQSVLDSLSAGFDNRYSVHLATSGSEALSTLGDTPIQIIVSAMDLPGMSGLEALREAKKRLPDMIGILLAPTESEAIVGADEVFQVVNHSTSPAELSQIVDSAAQQIKVAALSVSANDNEAEESSLLDTVTKTKSKTVEITGQHIVMETMDNGASIVSESTSRMFALEQEHANDAAADSELAVDVLVLSRDEDFLETLCSATDGLHSVHHAVNAEQALEIVANHKNVGVLVTDAAVAGNQIAALMRQLRAESPRLVGIVGGRRDDGESLMELINRGHIYRFLLKPLLPGRARLAIEASAKYHRDAPDAAFQIRDQATPLPSDTADNDSTAKAPLQTPIVVDEPDVDAIRAPAGADSDFGFDSKDDNSASPLTHTMYDGLGDSSHSLSRVMAGGVAAIVVGLLAVGGWLFFADSADDTDSSAALDTPAPATLNTGPTAEAVPTHVTFLDNARFARDTGRVLSPAGDNAIEWYLEARAAAPNNVIVRNELAALVEEVIGSAEIALLENRKRDATAALSMVRRADPDNPRLAFVSAQFEQIEMRETLDETRAAIREARFEDAGRLLSRAINTKGANLDVIDRLTEDLATARSEQRVEDVLLLANERLDSGLLTTPANDNARYYFELVASNAPDNAAARQGLITVASKLALNARASIDRGEFDTAAALLNEARAMDPESPEILSTQAVLQRFNETGLGTGTGASADAAVVIPEPTDADSEISRGESADRDAATASDGVSSTAGQASQPEINAVVETPVEVNEPDVELTTATGNTAVGDVDKAGALNAQNIQANNVESGPGETTVPGQPSAPGSTPVPADAATPDPEAQTRSDSPSPTQISPMAISELTRTNYVAPRYPRNAQRRGLSGWVEVEFMITETGGIDSINILNSMPGKVFDKAATTAVAQWRFEPVLVDGRPVPRRVSVRMSFDLE